MKTVKELNVSVVRRLKYCWGENVAVFFMVTGVFSAVVLIWLMAADFLRAADTSGFSGRRIDLFNVPVLAATAAALFLLWIVSTPFSYGVKWYRIQQIRGNSVHARGIFSCYGSLKRLGQVFRLSAALILERLYFTIPLTALLAAEAYLISRIEQSGSGVAYSAAVVGLLLASACTFAALCLLNCRYSPAVYLFVLEPDRPAREIIEKSKRIAKGKYGYIAEAVLSAWGWLASCIAVFPVVFAAPYIQMLYTAAVNEMIMSYAEERRDTEDTEGRLYEHN